MQAVEDMLDSCHALQNYGVDRYHRPSKHLARRGAGARATSARPTRRRQVNDIWRTLPRRARQGRGQPPSSKRFPSEPQENLLYFIEKNAPLLEPWQREIVRIVRKIAQYFYPQRQTQVMNEGWATFWHHHAAQHAVRRGPPHRRRDDRVAEVAHQRDLPAAGRPPRLQRHQSRTRSASRCTPTSSASASTRPTKTASGSRTSPARRGCRRCTTRCATSRTRASSASTCRRS